MKSCEQMPGMSVLEHGESVDRFFKDLIGERKLEWRLPDWFADEESQAWWIGQLVDLECMSTYHIYHDISKPFCKVIDENGKQHFPDHAAKSKEIASEFFNETICELIGRDMDMHLLKPSEASAYDAIHLTPSLLLTALAEIHSNATMFGGIESTSFKIKWKALNRLGKAFEKLLR